MNDVPKLADKKLINFLQFLTKSYVSLCKNVAAKTITIVPFCNQFMFTGMIITSYFDSAVKTKRKSGRKTRQPQPKVEETSPQFTPM